ncbi:MAG: amidase [Alphaproteobacteria bacterium]|nr:amidase [Alphaproteobacteria bacterium]
MRQDNRAAVARKSSAFVPHDLARPIAGAARGPLAGLTGAVKDMFDLKGERSGGGNPTWLAQAKPAKRHADAVRRLLGAGATIVGKTVCDEFFFSITGANAHYGTPVNPRAPDRLPGGSSSGSAVAVAAGAVDFALGSDTGGSVRVPAALNGVYGIRPSHDRVNAAGAMPMAPSFDCIGWFASAPAIFTRVGPVLLGGKAKRAKIERVRLATDSWAQVDAEVAEALRAFLTRAAAALPPTEDLLVAPAGTSAWREAFRTIQGREIWAAYGQWIERNRPALGPGIKERLAYAATVTAGQTRDARCVMTAARKTIRALVPPGTVLCLPTVPCVAPETEADAATLDDFRARVMALTCLAGISGLPQVTIPASQVEGLPVGLSFIGWHGGDETLLALALRLAPYCGA